VIFLKEQLTNPITIMLINMTIVFAVLYILGWVIKLIHYIDPTKKKAEPVTLVAPAPPATPEPIAAAEKEDELEIVAVITAVVAAYGYQANQIASIRPLGGSSWANAARMQIIK
jgi:glutaconyl-CoA decarboxylase